MHSFPENPAHQPLVAGENAVNSPAHLQGYEAAAATFPATTKSAQTDSATSLQGDVQSAVENLSKGIVAQVMVTSVEVAENDTKKPD